MVRPEPRRLLLPFPITSHRLSNHLHLVARRQPSDSTEWKRPIFSGDCSGFSLGCFPIFLRGIERAGSPPRDDFNARKNRVVESEVAAYYRGVIQKIGMQVQLWLAVTLARWLTIYVRTSLFATTHRRPFDDSFARAIILSFCSHVLPATRARVLKISFFFVFYILSKYVLSKMSMYKNS